MKWQKPGAPKPEESFQDLYDRARLLEQYEKQYSDTVAVHTERQAQKPKPAAAKNPGPVGVKPKGQAPHPVTQTTTASSALSQQPFWWWS